jgi:hypothetical protein
MKVQQTGDWYAFLTALEWRVIEAAAVLASRGRHAEAEATRYAAGYHAGQDDHKEEPPLAV